MPTWVTRTLPTQVAVIDFSAALGPYRLVYACAADHGGMTSPPWPELASDVIRATRPHVATVEQVFVNVNPKSTLLLGQARGTAICAAVIAGLPVAEYTALQVKQAVVGNGHASKEQVQHMVKRLLSLAGAPSADAATRVILAWISRHYGEPHSIEPSQVGAIVADFDAVLSSAGDGAVVAGKLLDGNDQTMGFNAQTEVYEDLVKAGVIDPTKVVRTALQDAASVAGLLITTEAAVSEMPEDKPAMPMGGGGMGGMGGMDF